MARTAEVQDRYVRVSRGWGRNICQVLAAHLAAWLVASQSLGPAQIVSADSHPATEQIAERVERGGLHAVLATEAVRGVTGGIMGPETGRQRPRSYGDPIYITESAGTILSSSCNKIYDP